MAEHPFPDGGPGGLVMNAPFRAGRRSRWLPRCIGADSDRVKPVVRFGFGRRGHGAWVRVILLLALASTASAKRSESTAGEAMSGTNAVAEEVVVYKQVENRNLKLWIDRPPGWQAGDRRPAVVFFHGGGWVEGSPDQFRVQSAYLASRGMVAIRVEYRLIPKTEAGLPTMCLRDAKSAMRWVRSHADMLGVDPQRVAAAGGSAGGHLAAFTALVDGQDDPHDDVAVSPKPEALILFNPVINNGPGQWGYDRVGEHYLSFSPAHHVTADAPPTIVFLGRKDKLVPVSMIEAFQSDMQKHGVRCETYFYPGLGHGFFNQEPWRTRTLVAVDRFLASLGWLEGPPTLRER